MNTTQQTHDEQIADYRLDFAIEWEIKKRDLKAMGESDKYIAMEEIKQWQKWLKNKHNAVNASRRLRN